MFIPAAQAQAIFQAITCTPSTYSGAQVYSEVPLLQKWMNIMNNSLLAPSGALIAIPTYY